MRACYVLDATYCVAGAVAECRISHDSRSACFWGFDDWDAMKSTLGLKDAVDRRETAVLEAIEWDAYDLAELIIDRQWRAVCYVTAWLRKNRFVGDADMAPCFQRYMVYPVADPVHELMLSAARGIGLPRPWPGIRTVGSEAFLMPDFSVEAFAQRAIDRKNDTHLRGGFGELPSSDEVNEVVIEWLSANREQPPRRESRGSARPTAH